MKFRKKPVEVEAVQITGDNDEELLAWLRETNAPFLVVGDHAIEINTLEGKMLARPGWWIVRGVEGEFYPVKPEIFAKIYERVEEPVGA